MEYSVPGCVMRKFRACPRNWGRLAPACTPHTSIQVPSHQGCSLTMQVTFPTRANYATEFIAKWNLCPHKPTEAELHLCLSSQDSPLQAEVGVFTMDIQDRESEMDTEVLEFEGMDYGQRVLISSLTFDHFNPIILH